MQVSNRRISPNRGSLAGATRARSGAAPRHARGHQNVPSVQETAPSRGGFLRGSPLAYATVHRSVAPGFDAPLGRAKTGARFEPLYLLLQKENPIQTGWGFLFGAGDEARTRYLDLGKVALYQMSYARTTMVIIRHRRAVVKPFFCFCRFFHRYGRCKTQKPPPGTVTASIT